MITKENAKDWLPLVAALAEGKKVQCLSSNMGWVEVESIDTLNGQPWGTRIAPEPKRVPLTAEDIPAVCWVRALSGLEHLVTSVSQDELKANDQWVSFNHLCITNAEYSTDRKTWKPCWKEVAE